MNKILLISPPDYYHGQIKKALLVNPNAGEKQAVQDWLRDNDEEIAVYIYDNNSDLDWLINTINSVDSAYFNIDNSTDISYHYISYLIANPKVTYKSLVMDYSPINRDKVYNIDEYIQRNWLG